MSELVLIRGGGDIASGIAYRLYRAGYHVIMTEIAIPTMIRREVCFGNAVHRGEMIVEGITSEYVSLNKALETVEKGIIPIVTDNYQDILEKITPKIVVDAILAKRNLGTSKDDAEFVIGIGPGFIAGEDVHAIVETMRGHTLGRVIYKGSALPNTGVPGKVGGFTVERVMYAPCSGLFTAKCHIGDLVEKNDIVGYVDETPVRTQIAGYLRGILHSGIIVNEGLKLADVDARAEESHCFTISDKALAIAGGVLEAILAHRNS